MYTSLETDLSIHSEDGVIWYADEPLSIYKEPLFSGTLDECKEFMQNYFEELIKKHLEPA